MTTQAYRNRSPLLTIIIAAYNVEIYIDDALNSLLSHPFIDAVDIIVIDDGSQDRTYAVAKAVVEADGGEHVLLIHQSNGGLSDARNKGCAHVRTPYVGFLDGDDMFLPEFLSVVIPLLAGNWDMIEYNATIINDRNEPLLDLEVVPPVLAGGRDTDRKTVMQFATRFHCFMWARVYRTTLFDRNPFPIARHYEDAAVLPSVYLRARSVYYVTKPLICYRRRFGSITQTHLLQQVHDLHVTGLEALARCNGGEHDEFWHTVYRKVFRRACHVSARVDRAVFRDALNVLGQMAIDYQVATRAARRGREVGSLGRFISAVRADRCVFLVKELGKKVLRRELYRSQQERPAVRQ